MMALAVIVGVGALVWAATVFAGRLPAVARIPVAAAVMFGLTGYLLVGRPGLAGLPKQPPALTDSAGFGEEITDPRRGMTERFGEASQWLAASDGMARTGRHEASAQLLQRALSQYPRNIDLWIGFGNALVAQSGGVMTPASALAFERAAAIDPGHPGPPFFAGLSLAQGGDYAGARMVWQQLLDRSPADAPWREDLTQRLASLPQAPVEAPDAAPSAPASSDPARP